MANAPGKLAEENYKSAATSVHGREAAGRMLPEACKQAAPHRWGGYCKTRQCRAAAADYQRVDKQAVCCKKAARPETAELSRAEDTGSPRSADHGQE